MKFIMALSLCLIASLLPSFGQAGEVVELTIHAVSLEGNLVGDSPDLNVDVYLPPGYDTQSTTRYPVVYWLHGFLGHKNTGRPGLDEDTLNEIGLLIEAGSLKPMIIVMPDGTNRFGGSMYTNSMAIGNWEDFITYELPEYIDTNYRTIAMSESRGIGGHSMGGYGAIKIAMKHPDIFSVVYGANSCCLAQSPDDFSQQIIDTTMAVRSWEALESGQFYSKAILSQSAAYAPNPELPPFYGDLPYPLPGDAIAISDRAKAKWLANIPSFMADQYYSNLQQLEAIAFDVGTYDIPNLLGYNEYFSETLTKNKVTHSFEIFEGGHGDKLNERFVNIIVPFFSEELASYD